MLFDLRPKASKAELYGREDELKRITSSFKSDVPLILLLGVRRVGKTSLLRTALAETDEPSIYLDARRLDEEGYSRSVLYEMLSEEVSRLSTKWNKIKGILGHVKGVHLEGAKIELDWAKDGLSLQSLLRSLDDWSSQSRNARNVLVAVDEAQLLRNMAGGKGRIDFRSLIAYCYDNLRHIKFVLVGSEVGLLLGFLGLEDPKSPLYGRGRTEIILRRFSRKKSLGFLEAGFRECGINYKKEMLEMVVDKLDGVVGWLTLYGNKASEAGRPDRNLLASVIELAKVMAKKEIESVLARSRYYRLALGSLGNGRFRWSEIKKDIISQTGRFVTDAQVSRALDGLSRLGIVSKERDQYQISDPVVRELACRL
jgi:AAA+ ATPase superfamily predicted ATPase